MALMSSWCAAVTRAILFKEYFANYFLHMSDVTFDMEHNKMGVHQITDKVMNNTFWIGVYSGMNEEMQVSWSKK